MAFALLWSPRLINCEIKSISHTSIQLVILTWTYKEPNYQHIKYMQRHTNQPSTPPQGYHMALMHKHNYGAGSRSNCWVIQFLHCSLMDADVSTSASTDCSGCVFRGYHFDPGDLVSVVEHLACDVYKGLIISWSLGLLSYTNRYSSYPAQRDDCGFVYIPMKVHLRGTDWAVSPLQLCGRSNYSNN
jgi:hypothetical protein